MGTSYPNDTSQLRLVLGHRVWWKINLRRNITEAHATHGGFLDDRNSLRRGVDSPCILSLLTDLLPLPRREPSEGGLLPPRGHAAPMCRGGGCKAAFSEYSPCAMQLP